MNLEAVADLLKETIRDYQAIQGASGRKAKLAQQFVSGEVWGIMEALKELGYGHVVDEVQRSIDEDTPKTKGERLLDRVFTGGFERIQVLRRGGLPYDTR